MEHAVVPLSTMIRVHDLNRSLCHKPLANRSCCRNKRLPSMQEICMVVTNLTTVWVIILVDSLKRLAKSQRCPQDQRTG
jgi:hypothetical protein